jgi:hypothetical protein
MKAAKTILAAGVGMLSLLMIAQNASAITYQITSDHATGGLGTAPFGTVELIQNGTTVDVTVSLTAGYSFVLTGSADFMDFKFNAIGVVLGDITIDQNATFNNGNTLAAATGAFNGDGTGTFGFGIYGVGQKNGGAGTFSTDIIFHVANATIADLTQPNSLGNIFVADLLSPNGNTGPADVHVPDSGSTLMLLGAALAGLGTLSKRFKK